MSKKAAVVDSVDRARREVRVIIPSLTDGADTPLLAELEYPLGDRSEQTEIRILPGDRVWVEFQDGDPRYPIITGFRTKHVENEPDTRRWVHDNIESIADLLYRIQAGQRIEAAVGPTKIEVTDGEIKLTAGGSTIVMNDAGITLNGTRIDLNP